MKFIKSATTINDLFDDQVPEICLIGRSNVGKSSLINALANSKIARVSSVPGKTQLVNYFDCSVYRLVDLPGYGFARVSKQVKSDLVAIVENYLQQSKNLKAIFQVLDAAVITDLDIKMAEYFSNMNLIHYILLNKIDRQSGNYQNHFNKIIRTLNVKPEQVIMVSAKKGTNIKQLKNLMYKVATERHETRVR